MVQRDLLRPGARHPAGAALGAERLARGGAGRRRSGSGRLRYGCAASAQAFALDPLDVDLLLVALAPDLDARFERLYGYLHDDVTRRRASIGLALELVGLPRGLRGGAATGSRRQPRSSRTGSCSSRTASGRS